MAHPSTLYRFQIELTDITRGVYDTLDFRAAMHPSESPLYLVTRVLAFALNVDATLAFTPGGLSDPDEPAIRSVGENGTAQLWIEIGNPTARRLHKASKSARKVKIYTYKDPELLLKEIRGGQVHRANEIDVFSFDTKFLESLAAALERNNAWTVINNEGSVTVVRGESSVASELSQHSV